MKDDITSVDPISDTIQKFAEQKQVELAPNGAPASDYVWNKQLMLSPNAVNFLFRVLNEYDPEFDEHGMRIKLLVDIFDLKLD